PAAARADNADFIDDDARSVNRCLSVKGRFQNQHTTRTKEIEREVEAVGRAGRLDDDVERACVRRGLGCEDRGNSAALEDRKLTRMFTDQGHWSARGGDDLRAQEPELAVTDYCDVAVCWNGAALVNAT